MYLSKRSRYLSENSIPHYDIQEPEVQKFTNHFKFVPSVPLLFRNFRITTEHEYIQTDEEFVDFKIREDGEKADRVSDVIPLRRVLDIQTIPNVEHFLEYLVLPGCTFEIFIVSFLPMECTIELCGVSNLPNQSEIIHEYTQYQRCSPGCFNHEISHFLYTPKDLNVYLLLDKDVRIFLEGLRTDQLSYCTLPERLRGINFARVDKMEFTDTEECNGPKTVFVITEALNRQYIIYRPKFHQYSASLALAS
jgi:hypothetical protein